MSRAPDRAQTCARPAFPHLQSAASSSHSSSYLSSAASPASSSMPLPSPSSAASQPHPQHHQQPLTPAFSQQPHHTQQQVRPAQQRQSSYEYQPNREGAGRTAAETADYLNQAALLAEAAKRAQMAVVMRDIEGMEL